MKAKSRTTLRLELPRLADLSPDSRVSFALVDRQRVVRHGELPLRALAQAVPSAYTVAILHPADATLAEVSLPPLNGPQLQAAVAHTVEPLTLADPETLAIAHGPRNPSGKATVAWSDRHRLERAWQVLADAGVLVEALVPAPLALPITENGATLAIFDRFLLVRTELDRGYALALDPALHEDVADPAAETWLTLLLQQAPTSAITWLSTPPRWWPNLQSTLRESHLGYTAVSSSALEDETPAIAVSTQSLPSEARWTSVLPNWSLAISTLRPRRMQRSAWRRPLAWSVGAAAIWLLGLNLYAAQLRAEESALQQRMQAQVKAAFPSLPVVLDPLRQATQQRDALRAAAGSFADADFLPLALAAASLLPASANNVESLAFTNDQLLLRLADNSSAPAGALDATLAKRAQELGLQVEFDDGAWIIERQQGATTTGATARPASNQVSIQAGATTTEQVNRLTGGRR